MTRSSRHLLYPRYIRSARHARPFGTPRPLRVSSQPRGTSTTKKRYASSLTPDLIPNLWTCSQVPCVFLGALASFSCFMYPQPHSSLYRWPTGLRHGMQRLQESKTAHLPRFVCLSVGLPVVPSKPEGQLVALKICNTSDGLILSCCISITCDPPPLPSPLVYIYRYVQNILFSLEGGDFRRL